MLTAKSLNTKRWDTCDNQETLPSGNDAVCRVKPKHNPALNPTQKDPSLAARDVRPYWRAIQQNEWTMLA